MIERDGRFYFNIQHRKVLEVGLSLLAGLLFGLLIVLNPLLPLSSDFQKALLVIPFAFVAVILFNNPERLVLAAIAVGLPLNLDFSLVISPYARNLQNIASGNRTIVALTELRLSLILIAVGIGYLLWLLERPDTRKKSIRIFSRTNIPALGLILFALISITQSQDIQLSFFKIAQLFELFLVYLYLVNHIRTKQDLRFFITVLMVAMLAESILMIVQRFTGFRFSFAGIYAGYDVKSGRAAGTLGTADAAGGIISAYLVIVCAMFWLFPKWSQKIFAAICFVAGCLALIMTFGRAAWGSFLVAIFGFMLIGCWRGWVQRRAVIALFLTLLAIGGIFYQPITNRLTADDRGSAASRPKMFRLARNVILASPAHFLVGVGANNYALVAPAYNTSDVGYLGNIIDSSVHNAYLLTWAETGLFGLLFFIAFLVAPILNIWRQVWLGDRFTSLMALSLGCALVAMSIQMLVDPFVTRPKTFFVWLLVSLIASLITNISAPSGRSDLGRVAAA